jgi:hypothetical protein
MSGAAGPPLVLFSWDGREAPLSRVLLDAVPAFETVLFDYSGRSAEGPAAWRGIAGQSLSGATECKGEIYTRLADWLAARGGPLPEYVALIDDDVLLSVSGINEALHIGRCSGLDVFAPSLSHDSQFSHRWTLHRSHRLFHRVAWVEVMMPFYRGALFAAAAQHIDGNVSSWGIDKYLVPTLQKLAGLESTAIVDAVMASHQRPISSGGKVFRNGLTADAEAAKLRARCLALVDAQAPALVGTAWYRQTFHQRHAAGSAWQRLAAGLGRRLREWLDRST